MRFGLSKASLKAGSAHIQTQNCGGRDQRRSAAVGPGKLPHMPLRSVTLLATVMASTFPIGFHSFVALPVLRFSRFHLQWTWLRYNETLNAKFPRIWNAMRKVGDRWKNNELLARRGTCGTRSPGAFQIRRMDWLMWALLSATFPLLLSYALLIPNSIPAC